MHISGWSIFPYIKLIWVYVSLFCWALFGSVYAESILDSEKPAYISSDRYYSLEDLEVQEKRINYLVKFMNKDEPFWTKDKRREWWRPAARVHDLYDRGLRLMDRTHGKFSDTLVSRVSWFDGFFGDKQIPDEQEGYFRLKHSLEVEESEGFNYRPRFRAKVDMPNLEKRLKLIFSSEEENEFRKGVAGANDGITLNERGDNFITSALRWSFVKTRSLDIDSSVGVRFSFPLSPYVRLRYRKVYDWGPKWDMVFTETLFAFLNDESGSTTRFDIERSMGRRNIIRFSTQGTFTDESQGIDWLQGIGLYHQINHKSAISFHTSVSGITDPQAQSESYNFGIHYRQQFLRDWLFYEIVPEVGYERLNDWDVVHKVTLGVEVVMGNVKRYLGKNKGY